MTESNVIDGTKCTQIGEEDKDTGLNVFSRFFIDRVEVFPSSGGVNPNEEEVTQAAHGFAVGEPLFFNGTNWQQSQANAESTTDADGIVSSVTSADIFTVQFTGRMELTTGQPLGTLLYVDASTPGAVTAVKPSLPNFVKPVYKVTKLNEVILKIESLYVQGAP